MKMFFKNIIPSKDEIKNLKFLQHFGSMIYKDELWAINIDSASKGVGVGFFCAYIPLPIQMILAVLIAIILRANVGLALASVWITNPLTVGPMFYLAYYIGSSILGTSMQQVGIEISWDWLLIVIIHSWKPLILGCMISGITLGMLGYFSVRLLWRLG